MNRRNFIYSGTAALSGLVLSSCVTRMPYVNSYGASAANSPSGLKGNAVFGYINKESRKSTLRMMNWDDLTFKDYVLPIYKNPHYVFRSLSNPSEVYIV